MREKEIQDKNIEQNINEEKSEKKMTNKEEEKKMSFRKCFNNNASFSHEQSVVTKVLILKVSLKERIIWSWKVSFNFFFLVFVF